MAIAINCTLCARRSASYTAEELGGVTHVEQLAALREKLTAAKWDCRRLLGGVKVDRDLDYCPSCARFV